MSTATRPAGESGRARKGRALDAAPSGHPQSVPEDTPRYDPERTDGSSHASDDPEHGPASAAWASVRSGTGSARGAGALAPAGEPSPGAAHLFAPQRPVAERAEALRCERNPGLPLDLGWVRSVRVNRSAVERRAASLPGRRTVKKEWQAAWLLRAMTCIDLTTLAGDDTHGNVARLCAKARRPLQQDLLEALGVADLGLRVGAVCVYHNLVADAVAALAGAGGAESPVYRRIPVAAVSTGFPAGQSPLPLKLAEIRASVAAGAAEIDIVISRAHVLRGEWGALYGEVRAFRDACGEAHLKTILATGELASLQQVGQASLVCMMAGADFVKTSTGKESVNATLPVGLVMVRAIREYFEATGYAVGFKPAGGIRSAKGALEWLFLIKEELGDAWLHPQLFRFGASGLLTDIERQLGYFVTGRYAAAYRFPMP